MKKLTCLPAGPPAGRASMVLPYVIIIPFFSLAVFATTFFLPQDINAQAEPDCRKIFDRESYQCLKDFNACSDACMKETEKPDRGAYINSGEIYPKCMKASDCEGKSSACSQQALTNFRACGKSDDQPAEAKKETPKQEENPVVNPIIDLVKESDIIDCKTVPVKACFRINVPAGFPVELKTVSGKNLEETLNWQPIITKEAEQKAWEEFLPIYTPGKENITVVAGEGEIKSPASLQFIPIEPKSGDTVQVTYLDSTMRATSDAVQLRYTWSADSGAVINVPKWSEVKFREPVEVEGFTSHTVELGQGEIEVKVRNNKPAENQFGVDAGWLGVTASRTHFWVSQSEDKKIAVIGVYEGEVEVKTKDGKTIKVSPDGDPSAGSGQGKPGVVVISQKLSPVKLAVLGGILVVIIVGALMILGRKFSAKVPIKKKR